MRDVITAHDEASARELIASFEARAIRHAAIHDGRKLLWRQYGEGPPLVLLHGGHGSGLHWIRNVDALSRAHSVWVPDMPSFGDSDALEGHPHAKDRLARLVDALARTMEGLVGGHTDVDLAGFSFGGLTAANIAARHGRVRRVALLGPGGHGGARRQTIDLVDWRLPGRDAMLAALRRNLVPFMLHDERNADALALAVHEWSCVRTRFRSKSIAQEGRLPAALDAIDIPVLMLWGESDVTATPDEIGPRLARGHPARRFELVKDAGHWAQYEQSDAVNARLSRWFDASDPT